MIDIRNPDVMAEIRKMAKDSFWVACGQAVAILLGLISLAILARVFDAKDFGHYQLVFAYLAVGRMTALPGMTQAVSKGVIKGHDYFFLLAVRKSFYWSLLGATLFSCVGLFRLVNGGESVLNWMLVISGVFLPGYALEKWDVVLISKRKFKESRQISVFNSAISLLVISLVAYLTRDIIAVFTVTCVMQVVSNLIGILAARRVIEEIVPDPVVEGELFRFGWKMTGFTAFGLVVGKIDRLVLGTLDPVMLAVYHIGARVPELIKSNVKAFLSIPVMHWGALDRRDNILRLARSWWIFLVMGALVSAGIWGLAPWFVTALFGEQYGQAVIVTRLLSLTIGLALVKYMVGNLDLLQNDGKAYRRLTLLSQVLYVPLLLFLVHHHKILGVVYAILIVELLTFMAFLAYFVAMYKNLTRQHQIYAA